MRRRVAVQEGQRYIQEFKNGPVNMLWEVASLYPDKMQIQHARLVNISDRSEIKTLSCFALDGEHGFSLIST